MKQILALLILLIVAMTLHAQELMPLPNMSSSKVPTARDAEAIVLQKITEDPNGGLSATESIVAKLSFILGADFTPFGKKGDRIWQVHRVSFAQTTSITWVNAESKTVKVLYPQKKKKRMSYAERLNRRRTSHKTEHVEQPAAQVQSEGAPSD